MKPKLKPGQEYTGYVDGLMFYEGPQGSSYYYKFKIDGRTIEGSCETTSIRAAEARLDALKTEAREQRKRGELPRYRQPTLREAYAAWSEEMEEKATAAHLRIVNSY